MDRVDRVTPQSHTDICLSTEALLYDGHIVPTHGMMPQMTAGQMSEGDGGRINPKEVTIAVPWEKGPLSLKDMAMKNFVLTQTQILTWTNTPSLRLFEHLFVFCWLYGFVCFCRQISFGTVRAKRLLVCFIDCCDSMDLAWT